MMPRKKNKNAQKEQSSGGSKKASLFGVPGLFMRFGSKKTPVSDPSKSPTSPLDYKLFNLSNPFLRSPRVDGPRKSWDCDRVRFGLADALLDRSGSTGILLGNQIRINISNPNIAPVVPPEQTDEGLPCLELDSPEFSLGELGYQMEPGKIRSCFADFGRSSHQEGEFMYHGSKSSDVLTVESVVKDITPEKLIASLSASEIEESEDYTRIITHGPNPKTTHMFGDRILDCHPGELISLSEKESGAERSSLFLVRHSEEITVHSLADDFLSYCYTCKRKLGSGDDIYMYRGEKAFCSSECREQEILAEERNENAVNNSSKPPATSSGNKETLRLDKAVLATYISK